MEEKGLGKPKVSLQFELSQSGITELVKAEAAVEETYTVEEEVEVEDEDEAAEPETKAEDDASAESESAERKTEETPEEGDKKTDDGEESSDAEAEPEGEKKDEKKKKKKEKKTKLVEKVRFDCLSCLLTTSRSLHSLFSCLVFVGPNLLLFRMYRRRRGRTRRHWLLKSTTSVRFSPCLKKSLLNPRPSSMSYCVRTRSESNSRLHAIG